MPTYEITAPDGKVLEITAPDGATQDEVLAYAQAQYKPTAASPPPAPPERHSGIDGMGGMERFLAGMGKSVADTGRGLVQAGTDAAARTTRNAALAANRVGMEGLAGSIARNVGAPLAERQAQNAEAAAEARAVDADLMDTGTGMAGNITGAVLQTAIPGGGASGQAAALMGRAAPYVGAAARGAAYAGAQPVVGDESRAANAAVGGAAGAAGQGFASLIGSGLAKARQAANPVVQKGIQAAREAGIPLHLSQVTDSRFLKALSSSLASLPLSGSASAARAQQQGFNRAVSRTFGADAPVLSDDVMAGARRSIGDTYNDVFSRNTVDLAEQDLRRMAQVEANALKDLTGDKAQVVRNQFQRIIDDFADGPVEGSKYQSLRESLRQAAANNEGGAAGAIKGLREALDAAAHRSVGAADEAALKRANAQWANMRTAEKSLQQVDGSHGNVRPASLWPIVRDGSTAEMRELARLGQTVLKDPIPNSGTAERQVIYNLLGLGGGVAATSDSLPGWARLLGGGVAAGRVMNTNAIARLALASQPARRAAATGLARLAGVAPYALPAAASEKMEGPPLEISVVGGRAGAAPTEEELEELRRRGRTP